MGCGVWVLVRYREPGVHLREANPVVLQSCNPGGGAWQPGCQTYTRQIQINTDRHMRLWKSGVTYTGWFPRHIACCRIKPTLLVLEMREHSKAPYMVHYEMTWQRRSLLVA